MRFMFATYIALITLGIVYFSVIGRVARGNLTPGLPQIPA